MRLNDLLRDVEYELLSGSDFVEITTITNDSRHVSEGSLFVCVTGYKTDGHLYIKEAVKNGCYAIVVERNVEVEKDIVVIKVENARVLLAKIANRFYGFPSEKFKLIGITGTNGKTSSVFLVNNILKKYKQKTGVIGTIENRICDQILPTARTTPDSLELQQIFNQMVNAKVDVVVMEVSSHALSLNRVDGCRFDIGAYTNLTLDHLDYHKTMENYRDAKLKLFNMCQIAVVNIDDFYGKYMIENSNCKKYITYGCNNDQAIVNATHIVNDINGTSFDLNYHGEKMKINIQTPGKFSVYNALNAIAISIGLSVPMDIVRDALKTGSKVNGRFQTISSNKGYHAIVDYAHTPDGLLNVLNTINEFAKRRVITIFGCGGDRDKSKRPLMAKIASEKSDYVIITSDNPRTEDPGIILKDIELGMTISKEHYEIIEDRKKAILKGMSIAKKDDIILVAGKGHEDYQVIGTKKIHFDDSEVIHEYLNHNDENIGD